MSPIVDRFFLQDETVDEQGRRIVREFYLSGILAIIRTWTAEKDPMPIDRLIDLVVRIAL